MLGFIGTLGFSVTTGLGVDAGCAVGAPVVGPDVTPKNENYFEMNACLLSTFVSKLLSLFGNWNYSNWQPICVNIIISVVWYKVDKAVAWCRERRKVELL